MADIVSVEDYKLYLKKTYGNDQTAKDNEWDIYYSNILLPGLTKTLTLYFDNDFQSTTRTETFSIEGPTKKLFFRYKPVTSITSVTVSDTVLDSDSYELLEDQGAVVLSSQLNIAGEIIESYYWPCGWNNIVIVYEGGYTLERGDKFALCKLIAMVDNADTSGYDNADDAMNAFSSVLTQNSIMYDMLNTQFKNYYV